MDYSRRIFCSQSIQMAMFTAVISHLTTLQAWASTKRGEWEKWIETLYRAGEDLIAGRISSAEWQTTMNKVYGEVPLKDLILFVDVDRVLRETEVGARGEKFIFAPLRSLADGGQVTETRRTVITKVAVIKAGRAVPAHAHENMVSSFLMLHGKCHVRQYDKLATEPNHLILRQASDEMQTSGQWSSISDVKTNGHFLQALEKDAVIFSTKVVEITPGVTVKGRVYFDFEKGHQVEKDLFKVPIISEEEAFLKT